MTEEQAKGKFIVVEGLDGSGKSTQIQLLARRLRENGVSVHITEEPTPTALGGMIRDALTGNFIRSNDELAALFLADRVAHNSDPERGIEKMLAEGKTVLCHRYYYSSLVYQGVGKSENWVREMNLGSPSVMKPDLCLFLDVSPEECKRRIDDERSAADLFEKKLSGMKLTRDKFFEVFASLETRGENIAVVDASADTDTVAGVVWREVSVLLK